MPDLERLKELQKLPLERKVGFTAARIAEWYKHYDGKVHVSFSGGKDSTVLLYIVRKLFPDVRAVFCDTGLEYPEIRDFVRTHDGVDWVRPEKSFLQVIREYGYPVPSKEVAQAVYYARKTGEVAALMKLGLYTHTHYKERYTFRKWQFLMDAPFQISHYYCQIMKKNPMNKYQKERGSQAIIETMTEESLMRRTAWKKNGCNAFDGKHPHSNPMSFWTEQDVLRYIKTMGIPIASCYGEIVEGEDGKLRTTGCYRTGCMFCMFGIFHDRTPNRFQRMYYTHPKQWDYCIHKLGIGEVLDWLKVPYYPDEDLFGGEVF